MDPVPAHRERTETNCLNCLPCPIQDCPAEDGRDRPLLSGRRLGLASMGLFLGPSVLAIIGAVYFGGGHGAQFLGAVAGLSIGMSGSVVVAKLLRRTDRDESTKNSA